MIDISAIRKHIQEKTDPYLRTVACSREALDDLLDELERLQKELKPLGWVMEKDLRLLELGNSTHIYGIKQRDDAGFGDLYPQVQVYTK